MNRLLKMARSLTGDSQKYVTDLVRESDRGCVVLAVAHLDDYLVRLHKVAIEMCVDENLGQDGKFDPKQSTKLIEALFAPHAPLSTFAGRIQLGYGYGFLSPIAYDDLHILRKLRNDAAHASERFSFTNKSVRTRVFSLQSVYHVGSQNEGLKSLSRGKSGVRAKAFLLISVVAMVAILQTKISDVMEQHLFAIERRGGKRLKREIAKLSGTQSGTSQKL